MKLHLNFSTRRYRYKISKENSKYYLYKRYYFCLWISDGRYYDTKLEAMSTIPYTNVMN